MNKLFIVRHGETMWNLEGRTQGHGNSELTDLGKRQARALGKKLRKKGINLIYSSDLKRANDTAKIIGHTLGIEEVHVDEGLKEMCFGEWEGKTIDHIKENYEEVYKLWRSNPDKALLPGGEKLEDVQERLMDSLKNINESHEDKNILIVSHGISVKIILLTLLNSSLANLYGIRQDNTALNIVEMRSYGPVVCSMNDISHLEEIDFE